MSFGQRATFAVLLVVALARGSNAATITVNAPDAYNRVFVDVVGKLEDGDEKNFKEKVRVLTDPEKVIVTLTSDGGSFVAGFDIGNYIRLTGMTTFVPAGDSCASACAIVWLAGRPRTSGQGARIGFHGVYDSQTGQQPAIVNALLGTYLGYLGFSYDAVKWMVLPQPGAMHWLTPETAKKYRIYSQALDPPRAQPLPGSAQSQQQQQPPQPQEPPQQRSVRVRVVENLSLHIIPNPYSEKVLVGPPLNDAIPADATLEIRYRDLKSDCVAGMDAHVSGHTIWCPVIYNGHAGWVNAFYLDTGAIIWDGRLACSIDQTSFGCGQVASQPRQSQRAPTPLPLAGGAQSQQRPPQAREPQQQRIIQVRVVENLNLYIMPNPYSEKVLVGPPLNDTIPADATLEIRYRDLKTDCVVGTEAHPSGHTVWCRVIYNGRAGWVNAFYLDTGAVIWDGRLACSIDQTSLGCGQVASQPRQSQPAPTSPSVSCGADTVALSISRTAAPLTVAEECGLRSRDSFKECVVCPEMVVVPAGSFTMGSPTSEPARDAGEGPQHEVTIARHFAVGRFAVTFDQWDACAADSGCNGYKPSDEGWGRGRLPVINVSWDDAKAYVAWLSRKTGKTYRLLSEAEREYVTRAGTTTPFWWGSSISVSQANYDGNYIYGDGVKDIWRARTVPVDTFAPNPWGLYQVHGNVYDWTEDCWHDYPGAPSDGSAWTSAGCSRHVIRGGSWFSAPDDLRAAFRNWEAKRDKIGFRVARTLSGLTPEQVRGGGAVSPPPAPEGTIGVALVKDFIHQFGASHGQIVYDPWSGTVTVNDIIVKSDEPGAPEVKINRVALSRLTQASSGQLSAQRIEVKDIELKISKDTTVRVADLFLENISFAPAANLVGQFAAVVDAISHANTPAMSTQEIMAKVAEGVGGIQIDKLEMREVSVDKETNTLRLNVVNLSKLKNGKFSDLILEGLSLAPPDPAVHANRVILTGFDVVGLLRKLAQSDTIAQSSTTRRVGEFLTVLGGIEVEDLTFPDERAGQRPGRQVRIESIQATWGQFVGWVPTTIHLVAQGTIPIAPSDQGPLKSLHEAGQNSYSFIVEISGRWTASSQTFVVAPVVVEIANLFSVSAILAIDNVSSGIFLNNATDFSAAADILEAGTMELSIHDSGGVDLLIGQIAKDRNVSIDAVRKEIVENMHNRLQSEGNTDLLRFAGPFSEFIGTPGATVKIILTPKGRVPILRAVESLKTKPDGLLSQFNIETVVRR